MVCRQVRANGAPEKYVSLEGSVRQGEEALARLPARYWHENPGRLTRVLAELEIRINVFPDRLDENGRSWGERPQFGGTQYAAPRRLLGLHERANGTALDGEGIQAWLE